MNKRNNRQSSIDLDEIRPGLFVVGNPQLFGLIKSEGEIRGRFFELRTWRREGLIARLQQRGFRIRTLSDQINKLPPLPVATELNTSVAYAPAEYESCFNPTTLAWQPLDPTPTLLPAGTVLRRRRGRGASSYYQLQAQNGNARLVALNEDSALLQALAQVRGAYVVRIVRHNDGFYLLPKLEALPPSYRVFLTQLGETTPEGLLVSEEGYQHARTAYSRLGLRTKLIKSN